MKWLVIAIIIVAQQPAQTPETQRAAEANHAKSTSHTKTTKSNQSPSAQPSPALTQTPVATESQRSAATANDHTGTSSQQASDEDRSTQRKLTWFTGVLAGVGVLQLVVMFLTWLVYRRQAREMRRQRHEMRRQRHVMFRQWQAMGVQATHMESQLSEMQKSWEIENKTLILQYRPKIIVRAAKVLQFSYELGKPWECEIKFTIVNTGGSPAYIVAGAKIALMSCIAHDIGNIDLKDGDPFLFSPFTLQPGQEVLIQESLPTGAIFDLEWENFRRGIEVKPLRYLFLMGTIYYTDDLNIPRSTGISRGYDAKTKAFVPRKEEEEEYAD